MKAFGLWVLLFLVFGAALIYLCLPSFPGHGEASMKLKLHKCRKLKENITGGGYMKGGDIDVLDYHRSDPVPSSSKASIKHGPILHDAPLLPYIPKPPPPDQDHEANHSHLDVVFP